MTVAIVPATVVSVDLTISGDLSDYDETAKAAFKESMKAQIGCHEPECIMRQEWKVGSVEVETIMTIPDPPSGGSAAATAISAAATSLALQPVSSLSTSLSVSVETVAAPVVSVGVSVPIGVAPPPPSPHPPEPSPPPPAHPTNEAAANVNTVMVVAIVAGSGAILVVFAVVLIGSRRRFRKNHKTAMQTQAEEKPSVFVV